MQKLKSAGVNISEVEDIYRKYRRDNKVSDEEVLNINPHLLKFIVEDKSIYEYSSEEQNRICTHTLLLDGSCIQYIPKFNKNYQSYALMAIEEDPENIKYVSPLGCDDYKSVCREALERNPKVIVFIEEEWDFYPTFCNFITDLSIQNLRDIPHTRKCYFGVCCDAIKKDLNAIKYVDKEFSRYNELCEFTKSQIDLMKL